MSRRLLSGICVCALLGSLNPIAWGQEAEETQEAKPAVFSGPQVGEGLTALKVKGVYGDQAGKTFDLLEKNKDQPQLVVFLHKRTRPAFGLARTLLTYVSKRKDDKLTGGIIWLTEDATATANWLGQVKRYFPQTSRMPVVYSPEGIEGPGAYGLNRNVTMTILVANKNKVTANFALVQPSLQADFPLIMKALVKEAGGEIPTLESLNGAEMRRRPAPRNDEKLGGLLRELIQKDATEEQVKKAAQEIETYIKDKPAAQTQLGTIVERIQSAGKLSNYGTAQAQEHLKTWGKKYAPKAPPRAKTDAPQKPNPTRD